jgi:hypothetical protein
MIQKIEAVLAFVGLVGTLCGLLANVLPDGKWKTAASYAGNRLLKASAALKPEEKKP